MKTRKVVGFDTAIADHRRGDHHLSEITSSTAAAAAAGQLPVPVACPSRLSE